VRPGRRRANDARRDLRVSPSRRPVP
jgi:hypothetical protein